MVCEGGFSKERLLRPLRRHKNTAFALLTPALCLPLLLLETDDQVKRCAYGAAIMGFPLHRVPFLEN